MGRKRKVAPGLGERLESLLRDGETLAEFAASLGVSERTIGNYIRGDNEPGYEFLVQLRRLLDVDINWLLTGEGGDGGSVAASAHRIDTGVMDQVSRIVAKAHKEAGIRLPPDALVRETTALYNEMVDRVDDPSDVDELRALLPWAKARLKKLLAEAVANPGTGKRSA